MESDSGSAQVAAAVLAFACAISVAWCCENVGTVDLMTGDKSCGAAPKSIAQWSFTHHTRRPNERAELETWVARHRGPVNSAYTAFCHTPLHIAARFGRDDLAPMLIAGGADLNARDEHGDRPLHVAAEYGNAAVVNLLLQRGAEIDVRGSGGRTPLHAAADGLAGTSDAEGRLQVTKLLIARGADVNAETRGNRFTPLSYASQSRSAAIAELLRTRGGRRPE